MKCPRCGSEVRPSKKYSGYYLCDSCRKRFPGSAVIAEESDRKSPSQSASKRKSARGRSRKKKSSPLKIAILLLFVLVIIVAAAFATGLIDKSILPFIKSDTTTKPEDIDKTETSDPNTYVLGDTATINGISIQALDYEESSGDEWASPQEGNVFVFVNLNITNQTDKDITVSSMASFESYCNEVKLDYSVNAFTALATNTDRQQMDGSIAPDASLNGYLCLEVPTDWTNLEIHYTDQVWKDDGVIFKISK